MQEYKTRWQEAQRDLQAQLNVTKKVKNFFLTDFFAFLVFDHLSSGGPQYLYHFCFSVLR